MANLGFYEGRPNKIRLGLRTMFSGARCHRSANSRWPRPIYLSRKSASECNDWTQK